MRNEQHALSNGWKKATLLHRCHVGSTLREWCWEKEWFRFIVIDDELSDLSGVDRKLIEWHCWTTVTAMSCRSWISHSHDKISVEVLSILNFEIRTISSAQCFTFGSCFLSWWRHCSSEGERERRQRSKKSTAKGKRTREKEERKESTVLPWLFQISVQPLIHFSSSESSPRLVNRSTLIRHELWWEHRWKSIWCYRAITDNKLKTKQNQQRQCRCIADCTKKYTITTNIRWIVISNDQATSPSNECWWHW